MSQSANLFDASFRKVFVEPQSIYPRQTPCKECGNAVQLRAIGLDLDEVNYVRKYVPTWQRVELLASVFVCLSFQGSVVCTRQIQAYLTNVSNLCVKSCRSWLGLASSGDGRCASCGVAGFPCTASEFTVRTEENNFKSEKGNLSQESWIGVTIHYPSCMNTALTNVPVTVTRDFLETLVRYHTRTLDAWMQWHPESRVYDFMVPVKRARQHKDAASAAPSVAKTVGLHVLAKAVANLSASPAASDSLAVVAQKVLAALSNVKPGGLFAEWSVRTMPVLEDVVLEEPTASCEAGEARKAFPGVGGAWLATPSTLVTWWSAKLSCKPVSVDVTAADAAAGGGTGKASVFVSRVTLDWDCAGDGKLAPRRFVIETSLNGVDWRVVHAPASISLKEDVYLEEPVEASHIRIVLKGYSDFSTTRRQGISSIRVYHAASQRIPPILPDKTLKDLTHLLVDHPKPAETSLVNHLKLVRSSASLSEALAVISKLLDAQYEKVDDQCALGSIVREIVSTVHALAKAEHQKSCEAACLVAAASSSSTKATGDLVAIPGPFSVSYPVSLLSSLCVLNACVRLCPSGV
jgi:hypothetical protein